MFNETLLVLSWQKYRNFLDKFAVPRFDILFEILFSAIYPYCNRQLLEFVAIQEKYVYIIILAHFLVKALHSSIDSIVEFDDYVVHYIDHSYPFWCPYTPRFIELMNNQAWTISSSYCRAIVWWGLFLKKCLNAVIHHINDVEHWIAFIKKDTPGSIQIHRNAQMENFFICV